MRLHHTSNEKAVDQIIASEQINPTWPYSLPNGVVVPLVWLSIDHGGWGRRGDFQDKPHDTHRITVEIPESDVTSWRDLQRENGTQIDLDTSAHRWGFGDPEHWFVIDRPVISAEWTQIVRLSDGEVIWTPPPRHRTSAQT